MFKAIQSFLIILSLVLMLSACTDNNGKSGAIISEEETVAIVNNTKIPLSRFQARYQKFNRQYSKFLLSNEQSVRLIKEKLINQMVEEELLIQEAARRGIQITDEELNTISVSVLRPYPGAKFDRILAAEKSSESEWKDEYRKHLLFKRVVESEVLEKVPITKREIQNYYNQNRNSFREPVKYKVRHILVATNDTAQAILHQLKKRASFPSMVRSYSISPDKAVDGELGFVEKGFFPEEIEKAIFKMRRINQLSEIVHSQHGYHIFKLEGIRRSRRLSFNAARPKIKQILVNQKQDEVYARWITKLKSKASIFIDRAMLHSDEGF